MSVGLQRLRDEPDVIRQGAVDKGEDPTVIDRALALDEQRRALLADVEGNRRYRNEASKKIGELIKSGKSPDDPEVANLKAAVAGFKAESDQQEKELPDIQAQLEQLMLRIPNPADPDVPVGGEEANETVRTWGEILPKDFRKPHWEIGETLDILDNARGAKIAGSGFPVYKGAGSRLQRSPDANATAASSAASAVFS